MKRENKSNEKEKAGDLKIKNEKEQKVDEQVDLADEVGVSLKKDKAEEIDSKEVESLKLKLDEKSKQCEEYLSMLQRVAAEFDNYKKRTAKEKDALCAEVTGDVVATFLPVVDSLDRAILAASKGDGIQPLKEGIDLVCKQLKDVMKSLGIEEIKSVGGNFDPQLHNAVMHITDDSIGENCIIEEFQKGYAYKEKVIRHSMVKVAN
jgi:molecular chaperone GrpE